MNNNFIKINQIKEISFDEIDEKSSKYKYYIKIKEKLNDQYTLEDIITTIDHSDLRDEYQKHMQDFNTKILYKSKGHGINHNIRVCLFAYIISTNEEINSKDFALIMEACKYHDIGRINDNEDMLHGKRSAEMLTFLEDKYSSEELNYIKTIITCHSIDDNDFENIAIKNGIKDIARCKKMHEILKDSDGLDRVRLAYPNVNIKYLRTNTAKKMIIFSHKLFHNYKKLIDSSKEKQK